MEQEYSNITPAESEVPLSVSDFIGPRIQELCDKQGITKYRLSQLTGLTQTVLSNIIRKKTIPTLQTLEKVCTAFHISLSQFFSRDEKLLELTPEQLELVETWNSLNPRDRDRLMAIVRTFR